MPCVHMYNAIEKITRKKGTTLLLYQTPTRGWISRSARSLGTDRILIVFVWPRPPFQPWTATIVLPVLIRFNFKPARKPYRMRLSTFRQKTSHYMFPFCLRAEWHSHPSATGGSLCPSVRGTTRGNKPCASGADEMSVRYE